MSKNTDTSTSVQNPKSDKDKGNDTPAEVVAPRVTRTAQAEAIFLEVNGVRKDCITRFMSDLNMSKAGASTYHANAKKKLAGQVTTPPVAPVVAATADTASADAATADTASADAGDDSAEASAEASADSE